MVAAHPLTAGGEDFLLTHAGLTAAFWREVLGSPSGARETADALNGLAGHGEAALFRPGQMLRGLRPDPRVGPLWAAATTELLPSWLETGLPFSQIHGHTSAFDWQRERFRAPHALSRLTEVDTSVKHETTRLTGGRIIGIDPGHGRRPQRPWRAWEASTP